MSDEETKREKLFTVAGTLMYFFMLFMMLLFYPVVRILNKRINPYLPEED